MRFFYRDYGRTFELYTMMGFKVGLGYSVTNGTRCKFDEHFGIG